MKSNNKKLFTIPLVVLMAVLIYSIPSVSATGPVNLRTAESFGVLAQTLSNTNPTTVNGDVGSGTGGQAALIETVTGVNHLNDAAYNTANKNLNTAINEVHLRTCDDTNPAAVQLGASTVMPGVHCIGGAADILGTVTLDGPGVYIFEITGALTAAANSEVALTNGAQSNQVFWVVTGATTLGGGSNFKGTVMSNTAVTVGALSTVDGRILTTGPATISTSTITTPASIPKVDTKVKIIISDQISCESPAVGGTWIEPSTCEVTTLVIGPNTTLVIASNVNFDITTVTSSGAIINNGTINMESGSVITTSGKFTNNSVIHNIDGTITNSGPFKNKGNITSTIDGTITNGPTGVMENSGRIDSTGVITSSGAIKVKATGVITSSGTFTNTLKIDNQGTILTTGTFTTSGPVNNAGAILNQGLFTNSNTITNSGDIFNLCGGSVVNSGTIAKHTVIELCVA